MDSSAIDTIEIFEDPRPRPPRRYGPTRIVGEIALTLAAIVGLVVTVVTFTAAGRGVKPLVVRSGSMEPTITTGSMVLTQPVDASEIRVGDVVSVRRADRTRVTHRVLAVERRGAAALTLKGHANQDPDPVPVTVRGAHRVIAKVPNVGRAATWLTSAQGGFLMGCIVTAFVTGALRRRSQGPDG